VEIAAIASAPLDKGEKTLQIKSQLKPCERAMNRIYMRGPALLGKEMTMSDALLSEIKVGICTREDAKDFCSPDELMED